MFKFGFIGELGLQPSGGKGGAAPLYLSGWPAVPRAAWSASARGGSRKKIAVSQKVFSNFLLPYVPRYSQFSCGFRRASEGRRNTKRNTL